MPKVRPKCGNDSDTCLTTVRGRGPYRKWSIEQPVNLIEHVTESDHVDDETTIWIGNSYDNEMAEDIDNFSEGVTADDASFFNDYQPVMNDHEDVMLDQLLDDLRKEIQVTDKENLAEDVVDPLTVLAEEVVQAVAYEHEDMQHVTGDVEVEANAPLFPGSKRTIGIAVLLLVCFMIRFRLSDETMQHLLILLQLLLPESNVLIRSMHALKKYLQNLTFLPVIHYYCSHCYQHINKDAVTCPNEFCLNDLKPSGAVSYFVHHNLVHQLQVLFKRASFTETVRTHRFKHYQANPQEHIRDVYDGKVYKDLFEKGVLKNPNNISFSMNTDGVAIFKSSKVSMWPVYMLINELPILQRKARENTLFYGVWISAKKPVMWSFLKPMYDELSKLEKGVTLNDHNGDQFICKASLLYCICDLPAKCLVSNSIQFNGQFSCWHCLQRGENYRTQKGGNVHIFPFNSTNPAGPECTPESVENDVKETVTRIKNGDPCIVHGIKGPSWLMFLSNFHIVNGFVIDYMHGVCAGVTKLLINLWFSAGNKNMPFSCWESRQRVCTLLTAIKPVLKVTRVPRSLDELPFWKSSEYRNFLLYWGIPILKNILGVVYFQHFCCLVRGIAMLSKENITPADIDVAEACLHAFVKQFANLYSERYMTMNIHQLVHLATTVRQTGPLFCNNCFVFEDLNGYIVSHIHGTQGIDTQVIATINMIQAIPILKERSKLCDDDEAFAFLDSLDSSYHRNWKCIYPGIYRIDSVKQKKTSPEIFEAIGKEFVILSQIVRSWMKIYIKESSSYVYASSYKRLVRRDQSTIKYMRDGGCKFGSVEYFAEIGGQLNSNEIHIVAIVRPFDVEYDAKDHIHLVKPGANNIDIVMIQDVLSSCMHVEIENVHFICEIVNRYDID